ncbi:hypothetical protein JWS13_10060 [Rhodococcus pseudokoreensis]|uniref:Uncharacterized protein n=1 Tax=Rhodococcus pseudokoreensis TaxID=2811421 RepID=A0A974ZSN2_9NOCA|nr:hypothetical protein [Rhodococcus pseudokoreensis]QSE88926.1 hypothetical protein JWS13_10060 [Rhodococcus pseudokoreensis]
MIDAGDVFGSLNAYMDDLDTWVREELGLPERKEGYHDKSHELREELGIDVAEWIRIGMTSYQPPVPTVEEEQ